MKNTLVLQIEPDNPSLHKIRIAAEIVEQGGCVAFPTETVYGLGADALNPEAVGSIFRAKRRPFDNPPIVHIGFKKDVFRIVKNVPTKAQLLIDRFWPGPLTLIFERSPVVPDITVAGLETVAVRMPNHPVALAFIRESGRPIAAPSANLAGRPSPTTAEHVLEDLSERIDAVLDAGPTRIGLESTVLDLTTSPPQVLRPGGIAHEVLREAIQRLELHPAVVARKELKNEWVKSPGMKHRHYSPDAEMILVEGEGGNVAEKVRDLIRLYSLSRKRVGVLATDETAHLYKGGVVKQLGSIRDPACAAKRLFGLLREFDKENVDIVIAEGIPLEGLGLAVMNRLRKASGYNILKATDQTRSREPRTA